MKILASLVLILSFNLFASEDTHKSQANSDVKREDFRAQYKKVAKECREKAEASGLENKEQKSKFLKECIIKVQNEHKYEAK
jgi:hypothetical protein